MPVDTYKLENGLLKSRFALGKVEKEEVVRSVKLLISEVYSGEFDFSQNFNFRHYIQSCISVAFMKADIWFIEREGKTIAQSVIDTRVNKVKELLVYTDLSPEAIARKLNFPSCAALSDELLQQTGLSIDFFLRMKRRKANLCQKQGKYCRTQGLPAISIL